MRPRLFEKLLWLAIFVIISVFVNCQFDIAGSAHPNSSEQILQFTSGGHVLGFGAEGIYVASGSGALHVQFVKARKCNPVGDGRSKSDVPGDTGGAPALSQVTYASLWDGVTLTYDAPGGAVLRSSYRIEPHASPESIRLRYNAPVSVESDGSLSISFQTGAMNESAPRAWQERDGKRVGTEIAFSQRGKDEIGFAVGAYDRSKPLFIDPTLTWNTFLGGSGYDYTAAVAVDGSGNVYVVGYSPSSWGSPIRAYGGGNDAFVARLDSSGNLMWHTFLGGSGADNARALALDGSGNVYVAGDSELTWGSPVRAHSLWNNAFAAKLDSSGNLIWNTFIGGSNGDFGQGVAVDGSGNVYVAGYSWSTWGSPIHAYSGATDAFAAKLNPGGSLMWHTFIGGGNGDYGRALALDGSGNIYVAGETRASWGSPLRAYNDGDDCFVAKLNSGGNLVWNTFLGGSGNDYGYGMAVEGSGNVCVAGESSVTWGSPVSAFNTGNHDAFAAKLNSSGNLMWNTFLGGSLDDYGNGVAVDGSGDIYVAGESGKSWGSPVRAFSGYYDAFAAKVDSGGNLVWNTFFGGSGADYGDGIAVDGSGNVYVVGESAANWGSPVRAFSSQYDVFVAKITVTDVIPGSQVPMNIPSTGVSAMSTTGVGSSVKAGYGTLSINSGSVPYATAVFSFSQNGNVVSEAGIPASPPTTQARLFVDYRVNYAAKSGHEEVGVININTGFAAVNKGTVEAVMTLTLRGAGGGTPLAIGSIHLAKDAHMAKFIDQLAPDFVLPGDFGTTMFGTLDVSSTQPVSILALRLTSNQRGDTLITTTPIADLTKALPSGVADFPQFVTGGGYQTSLVVMNTAGATETGLIRFADDNGTQVNVPMLNYAGPQSDYAYNIPAGGFLILRTSGSSPNVQAGSIRIIPDGGTSTPVGAGVFSYTQGGVMVTESGVPAATLTTHARLYVDRSGSHNTGLAIADTTGAGRSITVTAYQTDGTTVVGGYSLPLAAYGHAAKFADELVGAIGPGFTGVLDISSPSPFAALTLRSLTNGRGDFLLTTFPIADATQPAPSPIVFPQIANGGGYQTQFIVLSTSGAVNTTLSFFGDDGSPLGVGKSARDNPSR